MASIGIGIGIVKTSAKLLVLVLVLLRRFPEVLVLVLGRNFGIAHLCWVGYISKDIISRIYIQLLDIWSGYISFCQNGYRIWIYIQKFATSSYHIHIQKSPREHPFLTGFSSSISLFALRADTLNKSRHYFTNFWFQLHIYAMNWSVDASLQSAAIDFIIARLLAVYNWKARYFLKQKLTE